MLKIRMHACPHCSNSDIYISRPKRLLEELAILLLLRPVRCHYCKLRDYRPLFVPTPLPKGGIRQSRKPAMQAAAATRQGRRSA